MSKKIISLLLAAIMVAVLMPVNIFATPAQAAEILGDGANAGKYFTIQEALDACEAGTSIETIPDKVTQIKLLKSVTESITVKEYSNVEIDFNSKTLTRSEGSLQTVNAENCKVTLKNGEITGSSSENIIGINFIGGALTIDSMTVTATTTTGMVSTIALGANTSFEIKNSNISAVGTEQDNGNSAVGIISDSSYEIGEGNTVIATGNIPFSIDASGNSKIDINGGKYVGSITYNDGFSKIDINGGYFTLEKTFIVDYFTGTDVLVETIDETIDTYKYVTKVTPYIAEILGEGTNAGKYFSLQEALDACEAGTDVESTPSTATQIKLIRNIKEKVATKNFSNVELDLNGKTFSYDGSNQGASCVMIENNGNLTVKNGKLYGFGTEDTIYGIVNSAVEEDKTEPKLTVDGVEIHVESTADSEVYGIQSESEIVSISDTEITAVGTQVVIGISTGTSIDLDETVTINVSGGQIINEAVFIGFDDVTVTITGGNYAGGLFIDGSGSTFVISGGKFSEDPSEYVANGYAVKEISEDPYFFEVVEPKKSGSENPIVVGGTTYENEVNPDTGAPVLF